MSHEATKICTKCKAEKALSEFGFTTRDGYRTRCKTCHSAERRAWWEANPDKKKAKKARQRRTDRERERKSRQIRKAAAEMSDYYVKTLILATAKTLRREDIPDSLVAAHRELLRLKRELKGMEYEKR